MIRLLDTNTCIYFLNKASDRITQQFKKFSPSELRLSSITVAELLYGAEKSKAKKNNWAARPLFGKLFNGDVHSSCNFFQGADPWLGVELLQPSQSWLGHPSPSC